MIQVKLFNTRMDAEMLPNDQQALNSFLSTVMVKNTATQYVQSNPDYWSILVFYETSASNGETKPEPVQNDKPVKLKKEPAIPEAEPQEIVLTEDEKQIETALRTWRKDKSNELRQPEFMIFPNATLQSLAKTKPRSMSELGQIKGIGHSKIERYGDDLMAILNAF